MTDIEQPATDRQPRRRTPRHKLALGFMARYGTIVGLAA